MDFTVHQLPVLKDNYIYLIEAHKSNVLIAVDPALAEPVISVCKQLQKGLTHIFNTHHHWDHTDGNLELKKQYDCQVVGPAGDAGRIPGIDITVSKSSPPVVDGLEVQILDVPGHTSGHIAYVLWDALFCGDTLFGAGCGRIFEGTPKQMWESLSEISRLAKQTRVYCAHEYTLANLRFARLVDVGNLSLADRARADKKARIQKKPTIPSSIGLERDTNPFLRPLNADFCHSYACRENIDPNPATVFAHLRSRKDQL
jgi:hydroxyacylglutathione hydrolase